jgi:hypothetical protein
MAAAGSLEPFVTGTTLTALAKNIDTDTLDLWLQTTSQSGTIPQEIARVENVVLEGLVWDEVPEFAGQNKVRYNVLGEENVATRAAILLKMMPNVSSFQLLKRPVQNPVTFAAILNACPKLTTVHLTLHDDDTAIAECEPMLKDGFLALRKIMEHRGSNFDARTMRRLLTEVARMFIRYGKSTTNSSKYPPWRALGLAGAAGGLGGLLASGAYSFSGTAQNHNWQERFGLVPPQKALGAFTAGFVFGLAGTMAMAKSALRPEKFFRMDINGHSATQWFQAANLVDIDEAYDAEAKRLSELPAPKPKRPVSASPRSTRRSKARSPSRKPKKKK